MILICVHQVLHLTATAELENRCVLQQMPSFSNYTSSTKWVYMVGHGITGKMVGQRSCSPLSHEQQVHHRVLLMTDFSKKSTVILDASLTMNLFLQGFIQSWSKSTQLSKPPGPSRVCAFLILSCTWLISSRFISPHHRSLTSPNLEISAWEENAVNRGGDLIETFFYTRRTIFFCTI